MTDLHLGVSEVLVRYATAIDRRDWPLLRSCFTDDCDADYGPVGHWHGADEITAFMRSVHEACGHTLHRISNVSAAPSEAGATARSYVDAIVMRGDGLTGVRAAGYYDDELVVVDGGWRISRRRHTSVLLEQVQNPSVPSDSDAGGE